MNYFFPLRSSLPPKPTAQKAACKTRHKTYQTPLKTLTILTLLLACAFLLPACSGYTSPYNFENLKHEHGRFSYSEDGEVVSLTGIDVSDLQGEIDWSAVRNDGIDFAMIRLGRRGYTEGNIYLDTYYYQNVSSVQTEGIPFGVYFFSQATTEEEAIEEARFTIEHLSGSGISYPVVFDHEPVESADGRANNLSKDELTRIAKAFCETIEAYGYTPMIYGNSYDLERFNLNNLKGIDVWYAEYNSDYPKGQFDFALWQYTSSGFVEGVPTNVDISILFKPLDSVPS